VAQSVQLIGGLPGSKVDIERVIEEGSTHRTTLEEAGLTGSMCHQKGVEVGDGRWHSWVVALTRWSPPTARGSCSFERSVGFHFVVRRGWGHGRSMWRREPWGRWLQSLRAVAGELSGEPWGCTRESGGERQARWGRSQKQEERRESGLAGFTKLGGKWLLGIPGGDETLETKEGMRSL
jgi:hypothetical protein